MTTTDDNGLPESASAASAIVETLAQHQPRPIAARAGNW